MLIAKSLIKLFSIGMVLLAVGCAPAASTPTPAPPTPSLPPPTPTTPSEQNTAAPIVKLVIGQPPSGASGAVDNLAFSPDGKTLVSQTDFGTIMLWDVTTGQAIDLLTGNGYFTEGMALSPDGKLLASGGCEEHEYYGCGQFEIILWDVATRQPLSQPLKLSMGGATMPDVLFSPDGKKLAVMQSATTGSGLIQLFDMTTRQPIGSPLGGEAQFTSMAFSPDGRTMALGSWGGVIYLWGVESHMLLANLTSDGFVASVAFSPDGKTLASRIRNPSTQQPKIVLWDLDTSEVVGQSVIVPTSTGFEISSMAFSPDGKTLASIDESGAIILWDVTTHQPIGQPLMDQSATGGAEVATSMAFSPDSKTLASGNEDGTITLWDVTALNTR